MSAKLIKKAREDHSKDRPLITNDDPVLALQLFGQVI